MKYTPSANIEIGVGKDFQYIVTPNAQSVLGTIASDYQSGIHSFTVIGTYGTGKSSFLLALENDLANGGNKLVANKNVFNHAKKFDFLNILGDYAPLSSLLGAKLNLAENNNQNIFDALNARYMKLGKDAFMFIVVDEFGKVLEHAANNDPERELYFLQKLSEYANNPNKNIILLTTLHQNFGAYAHKLNDAQRQEWMKVKGRFKDVVFNEPVEQLLFLASEQLTSSVNQIKNFDAFSVLYKDAKDAKFISTSFLFQTSKKLYPLDPFSATCLTLAIQRYGQNERTLFSFLAAKGKGSLQEFEADAHHLYGLPEVYDYISYNFYSALSEVNADSLLWGAIRSSVERVESGIISDSMLESATKMVKAIGLLNIFGGSGVKIEKQMLVNYAQNAMGIKSPEAVLEKLTQYKIIRFANYKSQYILFEGTDIDIEDELYRAGGIVPKPQADVDELSAYIEPTVSPAIASYYRNGTPRYFAYEATNEAKKTIPVGELDGYIFMVFPLEEATKMKVYEESSNNKEANIYVYFNNVDEILKHLYEIKKLQYLLDNIILDDLVAKREVNNMLMYEKRGLNAAINDSLTTNDGRVTWIYKGKDVEINSQTDLRKLLSNVCDEVYSATPIMRNELFNKQKISSAIALARVNLLNAMIEHWSIEDFGFDKESFPPEKTIYSSLLKDTGMHRPDGTGGYMLGEPQNVAVRQLWDACEAFMDSTREKPRKLGELIKTLQARPFKLKQGFIDFWLPTYLFVKQQEYALYSDEGTYIINITKEVFELLQKKPQNFKVKAFDVSGVKIEFFKKYRQFLRKDTNVSVGTKSFIETIKPYLQFYRTLNEYAKNTHKFDSPATAQFREVLANAKDPEKTFFEDLPAAFGYKNDGSADNEFVDEYLQLIQKSVHELVICYDQFIDRIEKRVMEQLSLPESFEEYKSIIDARYSNVKRHLLPLKSKTFLERVLAPAATKKEFFERIANVVLDKRLDQTKDKEEEFLIDNLLYLFRELDKYVNVSNTEADLTEDDVFSLEMASNKNGSLTLTCRLAALEKNKAEEAMKRIEEQLTGDNHLDTCILLKMLNERIKK